MNKKLLCLICLLLMSLSGCTQGPTNSGNVGLVFLSYNVNRVESTKPGGLLVFTIYLENRGDYDAENVVVTFYDTPGFTIDSIECEGTASDMSCRLNNIREGENGKIGFALRAREDIFEIGGKEIENNRISETIKFSLRYDYRGSSILPFIVKKRDINIRDQNFEKYNFRESSYTRGPVTINVDSDFLTSMKLVIENNKEREIKFIEEGDRFPVKMTFGIPEEEFSESISSLTHRGEAEIGRLDLTTDVGAITDCNYEMPIEVPMEDRYKKNEFECEVNIDSINQEWVTGFVEANYEYNYKFFADQEVWIEKP